MKQLLASALIATLALTSSAAPAYAGDRDEDIAKLLFGLATIAIIGKAIENRNDRDQRPPAQLHNPRPADGINIPRNRRVLPGQCLTRVNTYNGSVRMFGKRCMRNNYRFTDRLPVRCEITVQGQRNLRHGYRPRCLERFGFTLARG